MRLQAFDLHVAYKPGKDSHTAETLSRTYRQEQTEQLLEKQLICFQHTFQSQKKNWVSSKLQVSQVLAEIKKYWTFREELSCSEGLVLRFPDLLSLKDWEQKCFRKFMKLVLRSSNAKREQEMYCFGLACPNKLRTLCWSVPSVTLSQTVMWKNRFCAMIFQTWTKLGVDHLHFGQSEYLVSWNCYTGPDNKKACHHSS